MTAVQAAITTKQAETKRSSGIDFDRGVKIRQDDKTGIQIYMYKDEPGVYYDRHGRRVPETLAKQAGFDVARFARLRQHKQKVKDFFDAIEDLEKVDLGLAQQAVAREKAGFKLVFLPLNRAVVLGPDGQQMCKPSSRELMEQLFNQLTTDDFSSEESVYQTIAEAESGAAETEQQRSNKPKKTAP